MQANRNARPQDDADEIRQTVHDVAATMISIRALAEKLAEHLPMLIAMSRSRNPARHEHIPPATLDALPALPTEIIELCGIAQESLKVFGSKSGSKKNLDAASPRDLKQPPIATRPEPIRGRPGRPDVRVLLVEDEETAGYVFSQTLEALGCRVTLASNGEDALGLCDEMEFDLVLMDLRLPGISGCETTERLRERESAQGTTKHIIGLTASPLLEDQVRAKAAGMDRVLIKPIDEAALRSVFNMVT